MTYDQWKTTPPEERFGYLCACGNNRPLMCEQCDECAAQVIEEEALMDFYVWEPLLQTEAQ